MKRTTTTREDDKNTAAAAGGGLVAGIIAVLAAIAVAIGGWLLFNDKEDTPETVGNDVSEVLHGAKSAVGSAAETAGDKIKDGAAEVPQAADDAAEKGDQPTTRPNSDGSTDKLDQK